MNQSKMHLLSLLEKKNTLQNTKTLWTRNRLVVVTRPADKAAIPHNAKGKFHLWRIAVKKERIQ